MTNLHALPLLSWLIAFPLLSATTLFLLRHPARIRSLAIAAGLIELVLSCLVLLAGDFATDRLVFVERHPWIPSLHIDWHLGIDGLSALFLPSTALLTAAAIVISRTSVKQFHALYYALVLALESFTVGIFCSQDLGLFFLFWELSLVPVFFLISLWGIGPHRRHAAVKYTLMMFAGGLFLLVGFAVLAIDHLQHVGAGGLAGLTFDLPYLQTHPASRQIQTVVFLLLLVGFGFKAPIFPFHVWLPVVAMEGPIAITTLLAGLKLGLYGMVRIAFPLTPHATVEHKSLIAGIGLVSALYGALLALRQTNLRRLLAYNGLSHVGLVLIGIAALNTQGLQGALFQLITFVFVSGGLFLICDFLHRRIRTTEIQALGGIARAFPLLTSCFFVLLLAAIGVPGTNGFVGENLILLGAFQSHPGLGFGALLSALLGAAGMIHFFQRAFLKAAQRPEAYDRVDDLGRHESLLATSFLAVVLLVGTFPHASLAVTESKVEHWLALITGPHGR